MAEIIFEAHLRLQRAKYQEGVFKQEKKLMIYVFSSLHNSRDTDQDGKHTGKPWSEMSFNSSLFSVMQCGCEICWNGNLVLLYSEMYLCGVFVVCACTLCLLLNSAFIVVDSIEDWHTDIEKMKQDYISE